MSTNLNCIAVDDEPVALSIIKKYCDRLGNISLTTYTNPEVALQKVLVEKPDIVFLDIEMNGITGLEMARRIPEGICIIFTTAYANYALEGFEVNAVDFLHKPFFYQRFVKAVKKAEEWIKMRKVIYNANKPERLITIKSDYKNVTVSVDNIVYVESMDNYVKIHCADNSQITSQISLKKMEEMLPEKEFMRVHKSYLVSINKIEHYTKQSIKLRGYDTEIPIGRFYGIKLADFLKDKLKHVIGLSE